MIKARTIIKIYTQTRKRCRKGVMCYKNINVEMKEKKHKKKEIREGGSGRGEVCVARI